MFAAGELRCCLRPGTVDISVMNRSLLEVKSYDEMFTPVKLKDGATRITRWTGVGDLSGHGYLEHSGEVMGFTSENYVFPKEKLAIAVLTNQDAHGRRG